MLMFIIFIFLTNYKPFSLNYDLTSLDINEQKCITYHKSCYCFGILRVLETYPQQYMCSGFEFCRNVNIVECK